MRRSSACSDIGFNSLMNKCAPARFVSRQQLSVRLSVAHRQVNSATTWTPLKHARRRMNHAWYFYFSLRPVLAPSPLHPPPQFSTGSPHPNSRHPDRSEAKRRTPASRSCSFQSPTLSPHKHHHPIRRNHHTRARRQPTHRHPLRIHPTRIPRAHRIHPVVVHIAVEYLNPPPRRWKPNPIPPPCRLAQTSHHNHIVSLPLNPSMEGNHPVRVTRIRHIQPFTSYPRLRIPQPHRVLRKPQMVPHPRIDGLPIRSRRQPTPPDQMVRRPRVRAPLLILEELLPHKHLRNPRRRQQQRHRHPRPRPCIPAPRIRSIRQRRHPRLLPQLHNVVILHTRNRLPRPRKIGRPQRHRNPAHPHIRPHSPGSLPHSRPDRLPQPIMLHRIEPQPTIPHRRNHQRSRRAKLPRPVLGILQHPRILRTHRSRNFPAKLPPARRIHRQQRTDLVIPEPVRVQLLHMEPRIVQQKSPHIRVPHRKRQPTHKSPVRKVEALVVIPRAARPCGRSPIPEVNTFIVPMQHPPRSHRLWNRIRLRPAPRMVMDHVEHHRDPVHMQQVHHRLHLRISWRDVLHRHRRKALRRQQPVDRGQIARQVHRVVDRIVERRRKQIRPLVSQSGIPLRGRVLLLIHRQRLHHIYAQRRQVLNLLHHIQIRRSPPRLRRSIGPDMQLIHHHVRELRRARSRVMPRIGFRRTNHRAANRKRRRRIIRQLQGIWLALVPARSLTHHIKPIRIPVTRAGHKSRPVSIRILRHQQLRSLPHPADPAEHPVYIHRPGPRSPSAKRRATARYPSLRNQVRPHRRPRRTVLLRNHPASALPTHLRTVQRSLPISPTCPQYLNPSKPPENAVSSPQRHQNARIPNIHAPFAPKNNWHSSFPSTHILKVVGNILGGPANREGPANAGNLNLLLYLPITSMESNICR